MNTKVTIAGVTFDNPVMVASGTFGSGEEFSEFVDLNRLGAVVTKGVANIPLQKYTAVCSMPSVCRIRVLMCLCPEIFHF